MRGLKLLCGWGLLRRLVHWGCRPEEEKGLTRELLGLRFANPVGLGAGFDKNALYLRELAALGFGFVEIGTVTPVAQGGNPKPRLFRLPEDQGLINRMGFNNDGAEIIAERLRRWRTRPTAPLIIGGNIGKNKATANEEAWRDYERCFRVLWPWVDYFVVNVSSPNTPGLRELQDKEALRRILVNLQRVNVELSAAGGAAVAGSRLGIAGAGVPVVAAVPGVAGSGVAGAGRRPLLLKIAPDLNEQQLDDVVALALEIGLDGLVAANTTIGRGRLLTATDRVDAIGAGGLSGAPLRERATAVVRHLAERSGGRIPLIASGGIFTADDAREKIAAGASLVQVWTGFIYEGPFIVGRVCRGLG